MLFFKINNICENFMINDKGLLYLIQPAELVGTQRYKIGYSKNNDIAKFRKDYKKGSRILDVYEYERAPLLVSEIRNSFNNKFKLVAGRTYYEGNENDIKKNFNTIINSYSSKNNINSQNLINNSSDLLLQLYSKTETCPYNKYTYLHNIMYGQNLSVRKQNNCGPYF